MKIFENPKRELWSQLIKRPVLNHIELNKLVETIFEEILENGVDAVIKYTSLFDKVHLNDLKVNEIEFLDSEKKLSECLKKAIILAKNNIEKFHNSQKENISIVETSKGVYCWREIRAIEKVGLYIPGGTAPLFSTVLMLGIPAVLAGCKQIVLCTPPDVKGKVHPAILYAANLLGITSVFSVGGIQAIAAMTFGCGVIPQVDKIFGPGNQYVTAAKQKALNYGVAIDMPAGASELLVVADKYSIPSFVASDLLSQAEHSSDSQVVLLSDNISVCKNIIDEINKQKKFLTRQRIIHSSLLKSFAVKLSSIDECIEFSNMYAPEHLILAVNNAEELIQFINNAGSVFIGNYSCESAGDYLSGTNHTLPTNGLARSYSGLSIDSFVKKIYFQKITKQGLKNIGPSIEVMAEAEGLFAHKNAISIRLNKS